MKGRVVLSEAAQRRLSGVWQVNRPSKAGRFLGPRAIATGVLVLFALFLVGLLHELDGSGSFRSPPTMRHLSADVRARGSTTMHSKIGSRGSVVSRNSSSAVVFAGALFAGGVAGIAVGQCDTLRVWGINEYGALNNVPTVQMRAVDSNYHLSVGLDVSGRVHCWGAPDLRAQMPPLGNVVQVCAGYDWAMARFASGEIVAWGSNTHGQCNVPPGSYVSMCAGDGHVVAIHANGTLAAWGVNSFGESSAPKGTYQLVGAGSWHSLALRSDGQIVGFGWNGTGQLNAPRLQGVVQLTAGWKHSLALTEDGRIHGWGTDIGGVLAQIPTEATFAQIDCSATRGIALRFDGEIVSWGSPSDWTLPTGRHTAVTAGYTVECAITCVCPADFIADGTVNAADLGVMLNFWGTDGSGYPGVDLDNDGIVGAADLSALLSAWGPCPE